MEASIEIPVSNVFVVGMFGYGKMYGLDFFNFELPQVDCRVESLKNIDYSDYFKDCFSDRTNSIVASKKLKSIEC